VRALRARQQRNLLTTLLVSQGVPMISHGDELGRTQGGNNNGYCQDNETTWVDWELDEDRESLLDFTRRLVALRGRHPVLRRRRFFTGTTGHDGRPDLAWFGPDGSPMSPEVWDAPASRAVMMFVNGAAIDEPDRYGRRVVGDDLLLCFNGQPEPVELTLPGPELAPAWELEIDTALEHAPGTRFEAGNRMPLLDRSILVLRNPARR